MKLLKKKKTNYFEKFTEELGFVELSTQAKYLRAWILCDDLLNDSPKILLLVFTFSGY